MGQRPGAGRRHRQLERRTAAHAQCAEAARPALCVAAAKNAGWRGGLDARLAFVILCWPVVDPLARYRMAQDKKIDRFLQAHNAFFGDEAAMVEGNPQLVLDRGEAEDLPPVLILQGTADDNLTPDMADRFASAYRKAGGAADLQKFAGEPHMFVTKDPTSANARRALALMQEFVRKH